MCKIIIPQSHDEEMAEVRAVDNSKHSFLAAQVYDWGAEEIEKIKALALSEVEETTRIEKIRKVISKELNMVLDNRPSWYNGVDRYHGYN